MKRRLPVLSPTQIELHRACPRKRFIKNALRVPMAQSPSAAVGEAVHTVQEDWITQGKEPDGNQRVTYSNKYTGQPEHRFPGQIFMKGRHLVPAPGTAVAESKFKMQTPGGFVFMGARDWVRKPEHGLQLGDGKTTTSPIYALRSDELATDVQNNLYLFDLWTNPASPARIGGQPPPAVIPSRWVYYLTDEPKQPNKRFATDLHLVKWQSWVSANRPAAWGVEHIATFPHVIKQVEEIDATALEIVTIQEQTTDPMKVRGNPHACEEYGGCPYANTEHCRLTTADIYGRGLEQHAQAEVRDMDTMSAAIANAQALAAKLAAGNPGAVVAPPVVAAPPVAVPPPVVPPPVMVAPPVTVPAPGGYRRPAHWMPGDPLNLLQEHLALQGSHLWVIGTSGDIPAPAEVAKTWPRAFEPMPEGFLALLRSRAPAVVAAPPVAVPAPPVVAAPPVALTYPAGWGQVPGTPPGQVESGRINPPEAPAVAAANPAELQAAHDAHEAALPPPPVVGVPPVEDGPDDEATRVALKAEAVRLGLKRADGKVIEQSTRIGVKALREAFRAAGVSPTPAKPQDTGAYTQTMTDEFTAAQFAGQRTPRELLVEALRLIAKAAEAL